MHKVFTGHVCGVGWTIKLSLLVLKSILKLFVDNWINHNIDYGSICYLCYCL